MEPLPNAEERRREAMQTGCERDILSVAREERSLQVYGLSHHSSM
jgi:hypothetical protein